MSLESGSPANTEVERPNKSIFSGIRSHLPSMPHFRRPPQQPEIVVPEARPVAFDEAEMSDKTLVLTNAELPWLTEAKAVGLASVKPTGTDEKVFYLGSAVVGKKLVKAAEAVSVDQSRYANTLFYNCLPAFIKNEPCPVFQLQNAVTNIPIYYAGNEQGQRVYFIQTHDEDNIPVIVKIAVCNKSKQKEVLSVLTKSKATRFKNAVKANFTRIVQAIRSPLMKNKQAS